MNCYEKLIDDMPSPYLPNDPAGRKKAIRKKVTGAPVKFDEDDFRSFVTGGHKRKEERRRKAKKELAMKKLEEKRSKRREKEAVKKAEIRKIKALTQSNIYLQKSIAELKRLQGERTCEDPAKVEPVEREFTSSDGNCVKAVITSL